MCHVGAIYLLLAMHLTSSHLLLRLYFAWPVRALCPVCMYGRCKCPVRLASGHSTTAWSALDKLTLRLDHLLAASMLSLSHLATPRSRFACCIVVTASTLGWEKSIIFWRLGGIAVA
jgi:hypothetical protein